LPARRTSRKSEERLTEKRETARIGVPHAYALDELLWHLSLIFYLSRSISTPALGFAVPITPRK